LSREILNCNIVDHARRFLLSIRAVAVQYLKNGLRVLQLQIKLDWW
jgi:hypothetical protein